MRISPMDIRQQQFTVKMFRGFDTQEVDTFLEDLAADYEALLKENSLLKEQLQALEERTRGLEEREKVLHETLVTTQRVVEEMKDQARREASVIIREAEVQADRIIEASRRGGEPPERDHRAQADQTPAGRGAPLDRGDVPAPARAGPQGRRRG